jgi:two-component system chemotaxis response regulator CheY
MAKNRPKIVIVEDSSTMRQLLRFAIQRLGNVEILEAKDGLEGLKIIRQGDIDVALVDINMPLMDGLKMVQLLRQDPQIANLEIIIITTEGKEEMKEKARNLGVKYYITKPINQTQVVNTLRGILQGSR